MSRKPLTEVVEQIAWPIERSSAAIEWVARTAGIASVESGVGHAEGEPHSVAQIAALFDLDAELKRVTPTNVDELLAHAAPGILYLDFADRIWLIAVIRRRGRSLQILTPARETLWHDQESVADLLCAQFAARFGDVVSGLVDGVGIAPVRREVVRRNLERQAGTATGSTLLGWRLDPAPQRPFGEQLRRVRLGPRAFAAVAANIAQYTVSVLSALVLARGALAGRIDRGWLFAWALLLITSVPLQVASRSIAARLLNDMGALLKRRLFVGALRMDQDEIRRDGLGRLLGRIIESQTLESFSLEGGLQALMTIGNLAVAAAVLSQGARGGWLVTLLVFWLALTIGVTGRYASRLRRWTEARVEITNSFVEKMLGHRTRTTQQPAERWHQGEDHELQRYYSAARDMDGTGVTLTSLVASFWPPAALIALLPDLLKTRIDPAAIAVSLAGILVAYSALQTLIAGLNSLAMARTAWDRLAPTFRAAGRSTDARGSAEFALERTNDQAAPVLLRNLRYRYVPGSPYVLDGVSLRIQSGDRVLLEGSSGGGKSTLAALVAGMRQPEAGLVLVDGLDLASLGLHRWRRRIVSVPQFHQNHVFNNTLAFNVLMGRAWPPSPEDEAEATQICEELGLGPLLQAMPRGLRQIVGETGWQLSQGERSRMFIARALLHRADVVLLDESLGALDPATHQRVLEVLFRRARTIILISHA